MWWIFLLKKLYVMSFLREYFIIVDDFPFLIKNFMKISSFSMQTDHGYVEKFAISYLSYKIFHRWWLFSMKNSSLLAFLLGNFSDYGFSVMTFLITKIIRDDFFYRQFHYRWLFLYKSSLLMTVLIENIILYEFSTRKIFVDDSCIGKDLYIKSSSLITFLYKIKIHRWLFLIQKGSLLLFCLMEKLIVDYFSYRKAYS